MRGRLRSFYERARLTRLANFGAPTTASALQFGLKTVKGSCLAGAHGALAKRGYSKKEILTMS